MANSAYDAQKQESQQSPVNFQPLRLEQVRRSLGMFCITPRTSTVTSLYLQADNRAVRRISRHLVSLFFLLAIICYLDRANLAFAASQLREDLHFSASTYGLGAGQSLHGITHASCAYCYAFWLDTGVFFIGYALFQIPSNLILVKVGAPLWLGCMLALWGTVAALCAFITTAPQFMTLRFLLGIAECGAFPGMLSLLHNLQALQKTLCNMYLCIGSSRVKSM